MRNQAFGAFTHGVYARCLRTVSLQQERSGGLTRARWQANIIINAARTDGEAHAPLLENGYDS